MPADNNTAASDDSRTAEDALQVPITAPDGSEMCLEFQWMRLHPCTAIALSDSDSSSPAVQVSRMMYRYRKACADKKKQVPAAKQDKKTSKVSPFLKASEIYVDPCDLIDPPLLSETVMMTHDSKESDSSSDTRKPVQIKEMCSEEQASSGSMDAQKEKLQKLVMDLFGFSLRYAVEELSESGNSDDLLTQRDKLAQDSKDLFKMCTLRDFVDALPTHELRKRAFNASSSVAEPPNAVLDVALLTLAILAQIGASEVLGRHVLKNVVPGLFYDMKWTETKSCRQMLRKLCRALLLECSLAGLPRHDLYALMESSQEMQESEVLDEFVCCLGEVYFETKGNASVYNGRAEFGNETKL